MSDSEHNNEKSKNNTTHSKNFFEEKMDVNGDGKVDLSDIIILGMKAPGIKIDRASFLQKEFQKKNYPEGIIADAIADNPASAGITVEEIDEIAEEVIEFERKCVSGISAALGASGGVIGLAVLPADIIQYYGYMLRASQKLLYLYGFPQINTEENGQALDPETMNILILCIGVMCGAAGANNAIKAVAKALAGGVEKQLVKKALTQGAIFPIVKSVSKWFSVKLTKEFFIEFFKHAVPVIGGVIGGGLTYLTFKPCCNRLKDSLRSTTLSNPEDNNDDSIVDKVAEDIMKDQELDEETLEDIIKTDEAGLEADDTVS